MLGQKHRKLFKHLNRNCVGDDTWRASVGSRLPARLLPAETAPSRLPRRPHDGSDSHSDFQDQDRHPLTAQNDQHQVVHIEFQQEQPSGMANNIFLLLILSQRTVDSDCLLLA